jgi:histidine triad (HIT) family protein
MAYDSNNVFAKILRGEMPSYPVYEDKKTYAFMDIMPASKGHTLVIPKSEAENIFALEPGYISAVAKTSKLVAEAIKEALNPSGVLITQLNGTDAGQTVFHYHVHIIPVYSENPMKIHSNKMENKGLLETTANEIKKRIG